VSGVAVHRLGIHHHLGLWYSVQLHGSGFSWSDRRVDRRKRVDFVVCHSDGLFWFTGRATGLE
jgi:hypothetical protein